MVALAVDHDVLQRGVVLCKGLIASCVQVKSDV